MARMLNTEYRLEVEDGQFTDGGRGKNTTLRFPV